MVYNSLLQKPDTVMFDTLIDPDSLQRDLDNPDWLICDCRYDLMDKQAGRNAYKAAHIPGAIYLDLHDDLSGPPITNQGRHPLPTETAMNALFSRIGLKPKMQVVVYDSAGGSFAARLWWMLRHMQHERVAVLDGGWQAWNEENRPVNDQIAARPAQAIELTPRDNDLVLIDDVLAQPCLIDSRDAERFRGEVEPIDKAAGHIPGAMNRCWKENLNENGGFKSQAQLQTEFTSLFGDHDAAATVFYCGSGVTACHNLLAVCHAGFEQPRLYAGSWSEWSSDPDRPVASGD